MQCNKKLEYGLVKNMTRLTEEQKQLVADNHNLIYDFLNKKKLPVWESDPWSGEDWYGLAAMALCRAAASYRNDGGATFATYAFKCMNNALGNAYRIASLQRAIPSNQIGTLDYEIGDEITLEDSLCSPFNLENYAVTMVHFDNCLSKMSDRDQQIIRMLGNNYSLSEVAKHFNMTKQMVSIIKKKFQRLMEAEDNRQVKYEASAKWWKNKCEGGKK